MVRVCNYTEILNDARRKSMKSLRFFVVALLGLMLITGLVACGSSDSGSDTYTASGTYTYDPGTQELNLTIENTSYPAGCGPDTVGVETFTVTELTETSLVWDDGSEITAFTVILNQDGTFTATSPIMICS